MSRVSPLSSPFLLGFDQIERLLDTASRNSTDGYPPYNIEHLNDSDLRITLAVAGFSPDDLSVTLEENQLIIRGQQGEDSDKAFLHRGIAARQFLKKFVLADGMKVGTASLANGLLSIDLTRPQPDNIVRQIKIEIGPPDDSKT
jgi:HSP20 family molecular chaperone IbpA